MISCTIRGIRPATLQFSLPVPYVCLGTFLEFIEYHIK